MVAFSACPTALLAVVSPGEIITVWSSPDVVITRVFFCWMFSLTIASENSSKFTV